MKNKDNSRTVVYVPKESKSRIHDVMCNCLPFYRRQALENAVSQYLQAKDAATSLYAVQRAYRELITWLRDRGYRRSEVKSSLASGGRP